MPQFRNAQRQELLVYVVLWAALFMTPAFSLYLQHVGGEASAYPWHQLTDVWKLFGWLLIAFLIHNFLLAPLLVYRQKFWHYFGSVAMLLSLFAMVQCAQRPDRNTRHDAPFHQKHRPPLPHRMGPMQEGHDLPPAIFGERDIISTIILFLMLGMNVGVKVFFRQREDQQRLAQLEKDNLEQQLEYLKYQINPHFLMNTLNNIHALIDINQEEAKESIVELSRIMRFVLYDGARKMVPLSREVDFLKSYIELMRMRYTEKVDIRVSLPDELPNGDVPPLLLITFVENAFKHGVSYQQPSFIDIRIAAADSLHFDCRNSRRQPQADEEHGGVGLKNVKRRLELIYGSRYQLHIDDAPDCYSVSLEIPFK